MNENITTAVALGDFDGMHTAHNIVVTGADRVIIYCVNNQFSLMQKSIFIRRYPNALFADFNRIKNMTGEEFIDKILIDELGAGMVLCGFNFRFGKNASMNASDLRRYLESKGVWVRILEHQDYRDKPISSSRIRNAIAHGCIEDANKMLGYAFTFESEVLHGDERGRTIGYPTLNQHYPSTLIMPRFGVYETRTQIDGMLYKSFTNIGIRPTWKLKEPMAETHIFDYNGDLYGKIIRVEFVRFLRAEKTFKSLEGLKKQLEHDKSSII